MGSAGGSAAFGSPGAGAGEGSGAAVVAGGGAGSGSAFDFAGKAMLRAPAAQSRRAKAYRKYTTASLEVAAVRRRLKTLMSPFSS